MSDLRDAALISKAWPFEEARRLLARYEKAPPEKGFVLFETGYGPSGLPHIGTFGEVLRTTMVRRAFEVISDIPTRLICFSDDMDGLRKVPDNVPNPESLALHLQKPLTRVPDPFGTHPSFGHHNNAMLRRFLDTFGFEYEFYSATEFYASGSFDDTLLRAAERYDELMAVMLKSLREERQQTYSIFLPISPTTGRVLYVPIKRVDAQGGTVTFDDEDGTETTLPVTGGNVKLQWKPDFRRPLGGARRRFRALRQGTRAQHADLLQDLPNPRRHASRGLHLRALPRRPGAERYRSRRATGFR